eukprot:TRINITY_DN37639_c0_g1_i1.p1 TRINITY_DN37639_c0_g1~~TRINITY_DN37639_c0_g1_i1.p1  ORF type:complete len:175 (-),score=42.58 TRINITY_DN37639_c0_g1_i1:406-930(-)
MLQKRCRSLAPLAGVGITLIAALVALNATSSIDAGGSAFVRGSPRSAGGAERLSAQSRALSDAERAAVLRLPDKKKEDGAATDKQAVHDSAAASLELSAAQRAALRMPDAASQAKFLRDMENKEYMEDAIRNEREFWDGTQMGPFMYVYYIFAALLIWSWILNIYRFWEMGHPH